MTPPASSSPGDARRLLAGAGAGELASSVAGRVQRIVASAEQAAAEVHRDAESSAQEYADARRAAAEADAERIRRDAEALVGGWLAESRERIDAFTQGRLGRLAELSEGLVAHAEALEERMGSAAALRGHVDELVQALAEAAREITRERRAGAPEVRPLGGPLGAGPAGPPAPRGATVAAPLPPQRSRADANA